MKYMDDQKALSELNAFCKGRQILRINIDHGDSIDLVFTGGYVARLSTLGGISISELHTPSGLCNPLNGSGNDE